MVCLGSLQCIRATVKGPPRLCNLTVDTPKGVCHPGFRSEKVSSDAPGSPEALGFVPSHQRRAASYFSAWCFANIHSPQGGAVLDRGEAVERRLITTKLLCSYVRSCAIILFNNINCTQINDCRVLFLLFPLFPLLFLPVIKIGLYVRPSVGSTCVEGSPDHTLGGPCVKHNFQVAREDKRTRDKKNKRY